MLVVARLHGNRVYAPAQLATLASSEPEITDTDLQDTLDDLRRYQQEYADNTGDPLDKIAKGPDFVEYVLKQQFPS